MTEFEFLALCNSLPHEPDTGCQLWPRGLYSGGYPQVKIRGKGHTGTKLRLELHLGRPLLSTHQALHTCDVKRCVNVDHLYEGTHKQNMEDMRIRGRAASGDRHASRLYPEKRPRGAQHWTARDKGDKLVGSRNGRAKTNESTVVAIRQEYREHRPTHRQLSEMFGVSVRQIGKIVKGTAWKHVA